MTAQTDFDPNLSFALSCAAIRYGLSRRSYAASTIATAIRDRLPLFNVADLVKMRQDIESALAGESIYGDGGEIIDRAIWRQLVEAIKKEQASR